MEPSEELKYSYIMEKDGRSYEFETYPNDKSYIFKEIKLLNPDAQPKITDYSIWNEDKDLTKESFLGNKLFIIIHDIDTYYNTSGSSRKLRRPCNLLEYIQIYTNIYIYNRCL